MRFTNGIASSGYNLLMNYEMKEKPHHFMCGTKEKECIDQKCYTWSKITYTDHTLKVTVTMNAVHEFIVQGAGNTLFTS